MLLEILLLSLTLLGQAAADQPVEVIVPAEQVEAPSEMAGGLDKCLSPLENLGERFSDPSDLIQAAAEESAKGDPFTVMDIFCETIKETVSCLNETGFLDQGMLELLFDGIPRKILKSCHRNGLFTNVPLPPSKPATGSEETPTTASEATPTTEHETTVETSPTTPTLKRETTEKETTPTTKQITTKLTTTKQTTTELTTTKKETTEPTTSEMTTEPTPSPTTQHGKTVECDFGRARSSSPTDPHVDPTEDPSTEPEEEDCFKQDLRTSGPVLKQVGYTTDEDCKKLCLATEGCRAVVTSPMTWGYTECFIIGEYTLTTDNAYGWDSAERECFDRGEEATTDPSVMKTATNEERSAYTTSCDLKVVSAGETGSSSYSWYGRSETWNGDVIFRAGEEEMLLIGLHPERGNLAVRNSVFRRGTLQWTYQWVDVSYPESDEEGRREYTFQFTESSFILKCADTVLITIPYGELTHNRMRFLNNIDTVEFKLGTERPVQLQYARQCRDEQKESRNWRDFSLSNRLILDVDTQEEETYLVRFPCADSVWFKLFLNGEHEQNSHIELFNRVRGNIYCNRGGYQSWYGGERTDFNIYKDWQCEDDGEFMILQVEKTSRHVTLKNRGNTLYTKRFGYRDGNCGLRTQRVATQVWDYTGSLQLAFSDREGTSEEPEFSTSTAHAKVVTRLTTQDITEEEITEEPGRLSTSIPPEERAVCDADEFMCAERCILSSWRCDGEVDCSGGEDEADCEDPSEPLKAGCEGNTCTVVGESGDLYLETEKKLTSENREVYLILERSGNLALRCDNDRIVWQSGTHGIALGKGLLIQADGNMVLYDEKTKRVAWESGTEGEGYGASLRLVAQDDNNLVLYANDSPIWASDTVNQCKELPKEGGCSGDKCVVLAGGKDVVMAPGESIKSNNGEITLLMQTDGNLVLYCAGGIPVWHSDTWYWQTENRSLVIKSTGEMTVVDTNEREQWSSNTGGNMAGVTLVAQDDNNVVLYTRGGVPIWHTDTARRCN